MNFLIGNVLYKLVVLPIVVIVIWLLVRKFRSTILKEELKLLVNKEPVAIALLEGLFFIGYVLLATKIIP